MINSKIESELKKAFEAIHRTYEGWYKTAKGIFAYGHDWKHHKQEIYRVSLTAKGLIITWYA